MPYESERANPLGYSPLVTDTFLKERLATFSFAPPKQQEDEPEPQDRLKIVAADELPLSVAVEDIDLALAVDGSLAAVGEEFGFELAALKIGCVLQKLKKRRELLQNPFSVTPESFDKLTAGGSFISLLTGEGVYKKDSSEDTWQDKFREELFIVLKHLRLPYMPTHVPLLDVLAAIAPPTVRTRCLACYDAKRLSKDASYISLASPGAYCSTCYRDFYLSDFIFTEAWTREGHSKDVFSAMMLIFERLLFHGIMMATARGESKLPKDRTLFVLDGSLAIYSSASLNGYFLADLQKLPALPLVMSLEKTGTFARFARTEAVQAVLEPGTVAMVTSATANVLAGRPPEVGASRAYTYGKRFLYRTKDGFKTFVFMAVPEQGLPMGDEASDEWATYPHIRTLCAFLEENATDQFGVENAAIDVIAEANHEVSLPKTLSIKFLEEMATAHATDEDF